MSGNSPATSWPSGVEPKRQIARWKAACLARFGTLRPIGTSVLRSDNGLIFQSRRFRLACRDYRLQQEFIAPYTPEQSGMIERFFWSLKGECVWPQSFQAFEEARRCILNWVEWYNHERPHRGREGLLIVPTHQ